MPLPYSSNELDSRPPIKPLTAEQKNRYECTLDGVSAIGIPKPKSKEEGDGG